MHRYLSLCPSMLLISGHCLHIFQIREKLFDRLPNAHG